MLRAWHLLQACKHSPPVTSPPHLPQVLTAAGCRVEVSADPDTILSNAKIRALIGDKCDGVIGQLTEVGEQCSGVGVVEGGKGRLLSLSCLMGICRVGVCWEESVLPACADTHACTRHRPPTQDWGAELFGALKAAGGRAYSNYAVG